MVTAEKVDEVVPVAEGAEDATREEELAQVEDEQMALIHRQSLNSPSSRRSKLQPSVLLLLSSKQKLDLVPAYLPEL